MEKLDRLDSNSDEGSEIDILDASIQNMSIHGKFLFIFLSICSTRVFIFILISLLNYL